MAFRSRCQPESSARALFYVTMAAMLPSADSFSDARALSLCSSMVGAEEEESEAEAASPTLVSLLLHSPRNVALEDAQAKAAPGALPSPAIVAALAYDSDHSGDGGGGASPRREGHEECERGGGAETSAGGSSGEALPRGTTARVTFLPNTPASRATPPLPPSPPPPDLARMLAPATIIEAAATAAPGGGGGGTGDTTVEEEGEAEVGEEEEGQIILPRTDVDCGFDCGGGGGGGGESPLPPDLRRCFDCEQFLGHIPAAPCEPNSATTSTAAAAAATTATFASSASPASSTATNTDCTAVDAAGGNMVRSFSGTHSYFHALFAALPDPRVLLGRSAPLHQLPVRGGETASATAEDEEGIAVLAAAAARSSSVTAAGISSRAHARNRLVRPTHTIPPEICCSTI